MPEVTEQQLWDDYIYWKSLTGYYQKRRRDNPYIKAMKATPERLELMRELKQWCGERDISARQWLYSLFVIRLWMYAPKLEVGHLCSKKNLERFATFSDYNMYTQRIQELADSQCGVPDGSFDPNRDISHTAEEAKRAYMNDGRIDTCMIQMSVETFGYHPKSKVCAICPLENECEERLQASVKFDIMALRRGEITAEQAYRQAIQVGGYGG